MWNWRDIGARETAARQTAAPEVVSSTANALLKAWLDVRLGLVTRVRLEPN